MPTIKDIAPESVFTIELNAGTQGRQGPKGEQGVQGIQGPRGETGPKPIRGIDYFTQQDINNMVSTVTGSSNSAFNENVSAKTKEFNENVAVKTSAFDNNAVLKTEDFNTNAKTTKTDFNLNANNRTTEFNTNASSKKNEIDTHVTNKTTEFDNHVVEKIKEFKEETSEYVTETELESKGYLVESDLNGYAKEKDLFSGSYNDLKDKPKIPNKTSELTNDRGFINAIPSEYVTEEEQNEFIKPYNKRITTNEKYISDLEATIDILTPKSSAKGELVHITDALNLPTKEVKVAGTIEQETTKGINKLDTSKLTTTKINGVDVTVNKDGSITFNGTMEKYIWLELSNKDFNLPSGEYTWSLRPSYVLPSGDYTIGIRNKNNVVITAAEFYQDIENVTLNEDLSNGFVAIYIGTLTTFNNFTIYPMLVEGTYTKDTIPPYEKYTNGASPNPEYPQEVEVIEGYNLLDFNVTQNEKVKVNNDGTISINGNGDFSLKVKPITLKANKNYYIKWELLSGTITGFDKPFQAPNLNWVVKDTFTKLKFTEDKEIKSFWINDSSVFENAVIRMWIATEEKPFLPYGCVGYKVVGKNRLNMSLTQERYEVKLNKIENEKIYLNVTGQSPSLLIKQYIPKGKYKVKKSEAIKGSVAFKSSTDETIGDIGGLVDGEKVIEFSKDINSIVIYLNASYYDTSKEHILDFNSLVMVNENDNTEYEPYKEQIVPLDLKGNWVGKANDYTIDNLFTDKKHLWLEKNVRKIILDGSDIWQSVALMTSNSDYIYAYTNVFDSQIINTDKALLLFSISDRLQFQNGLVISSTITQDVFSITGGESKVRLAIKKSRLTSPDKAGLQAYLRENPITILVGNVKTEIIELGELPEPIKTFEGTNNIQLLANLDTEIEVKYALDVKKYYDNKLAEISAQII